MKCTGHVLGKKKIHREHRHHEAETLEIIGPIAAMERIFTARKCTEGLEIIGSDQNG
jgi:hypothetical protein